MRSTTVLSLLAAMSFAGPVLAQSGSATATLTDTSGVTLGTVTIMEMDGGVHLSGTLTGVPNGEHGFHFHETGQCDAAGGFESAGAHFNPDSHQHGTENPQGPHAGDLQNVTANDDCEATVDLHSAATNIAALNDADGTALVLHADPDDYATDPSGNSGDRIACGVLEFAQ